MSLESYVPESRTDIVITFPNGATSQVNPKYSLTLDSARQLAEIMGELKHLKSLGVTAIVIEGWPGPRDVKFGGVATSGKVAWLSFLDGMDQYPGTKINAGILADSFSHGYPTQYVERLLTREYQWNAYDQGFGGLPGAF